jgi:hypothetical protein
MARRRDVLAEELRQLADDLEELWKALTRDPKVERRKQRAWSVVAGISGAAATMATRRALAKLWPILTGEQPSAPAPSSREQSQSEREPVSAGR